MSKNLLEEAIAEAKMVRAAAMANAKETLAESFTPHLKSMIAAKLEEEMGLEDDEFGTEDIHSDGMMEIEDPTGEEGMEGMDPEEELPAEEPIEEPAPEGEEGMEMEPETGMETGEEEEEEISLDELLREMDQEDETLYESKKESSLQLEKTQKELRSTKVQLSEALKTVKELQGELKEINLLNAKLLYTTKVLKATSLSESQKTDLVMAFDAADNIKEAKLIYQTVSSRIIEEGKKKSIKKPITESVKRGMASQSTSTPNVKPPVEILSESDRVVRRLQHLAGILKD